MTDDKATRGGRDGGAERDDDQFVVRVKATRGQVDELLRRGEFDFGDHPNITPNPDGTGNLDLFLTRTQIEALRARGYEVEVGLNLSARARERVADVGKGDRFEGGRIPPRGLGRKIGGLGGPNDAKPEDRPQRAS
jgi:hypothetical protein